MNMGTQKLSTGMSGSNTTNVMATRMPQVANELQMLHNVTDSLIDTVKELEVRLSPILLSPEQMHQEASSPSPVDEPMVPLAEQVRMLRRKVAAMVDQLESIRYRIEI